MSRKTRAQLQRDIDELTQQLAQAKQPPTVNVITVAYAMDGRLMSVVTSNLGSAAVLRAAKAALTNLSMRVDAVLIETVEKEAAAEAWTKGLDAGIRQTEENAAD